MQQVSPEDARAVFPQGDAPTQIEPRLWRLPLPLPFALRAVNVYLLGDEASHWTLVDAGLGLPADEAALRAGLAVAGVALEQISSFVLTHAHPDHIGMARMIQATSGAPIYMLADEIDILYTAWGAGNEAVADRLQAMYLANGLDTGAPEIMRIQGGAPSATGANGATGPGANGIIGEAARTPSGASSPVGEVPADGAGSVARAGRNRRWVFPLPPRETFRPLTDGQELRLGGWTYRAIWTPGHSDHHLCLLRADGLLIVGDHVLPSITPNIGLYPNARVNPLRDYLWALERVKALPVRLALPGHGLPFAALAERAEAIRLHHAERSATLLALLAAHSDGADGATLARALFGARLRTVEDHRFALAETLAHLEYLRYDGKVCRERRSELGPDDTSTAGNADVATDGSASKRQAGHERIIYRVAEAGDPIADERDEVSFGATPTPTPLSLD
ncbi:MAG TPA: MBL fold metallo-hydrolase [Ktedonobacterales bacterium]|nr:MBL fold metallo-hydrolase [Ktedonobacterales bacterium]